jgi:hypothetical protein
MHSLTIAFGEGQMMCWRLLFTNVENAQAAWDRIASPALQLSQHPDHAQTLREHGVGTFNTPTLPIQITDDYGQTVMIKPVDIKGAMFEDMANSQLADIAMRLHGARTQAMTVSQVNADPKLRIGVVQPATFNGGFPRQN